MNLTYVPVCQIPQATCSLCLSYLGKDQNENEVDAVYQRLSKAKDKSLAMFSTKTESEAHMNDVEFFGDALIARSCRASEPCSECIVKTSDANWKCVKQRHQDIIIALRKFSAMRTRSDIGDEVVYHKAENLRNLLLNSVQSVEER